MDLYTTLNCISFKKPIVLVSYSFFDFAICYKLILLHGGLMATKTEEYNSKPVPLNKRMGFSGPAWVWSGFGIAFICAVIGGLIQQGLGTAMAIWAIIIGNAILFGYSAIIGYASGQWGVNFPLAVRYVFGKKGAILPILILSLLVTGWYAFQAWLTADIIKVAFGLEGKTLVGFMAVAAGIIFAIPFGIFTYFIFFSSYVSEIFPFSATIKFPIFI